MGEDSHNYRRILDGRDGLQGAAAVRPVFDVDIDLLVVRCAVVIYDITARSPRNETRRAPSACFHCPAAIFLQRSERNTDRPCPSI